MNYSLRDVEQIRTLRDSFGDDIVLFDEQDESTVYRILSEFTVGGKAYAILQSDELKKEEEVAIFRISPTAGGEPELETIEDDDEWESISELYDEMAYPMQDEV